jgi:hypothetical protein
MPLPRFSFPKEKFASKETENILHFEGSLRRENNPNIWNKEGNKAFLS